MFLMFFKIVKTLIKMMTLLHLNTDAKMLNVSLVTFASMEGVRRSIMSVSTRNVKKVSDAKMGNASSRLIPL